MKKKLVVMLVLSTMIFCFAGCGKEEASESQSSGQEQDAETDNSEDAGDETEGASETADPEAEKNEDALEEENVPLESFQEAMEKMQPGDTVTMRVYVDSLDDSFYDYYFDLYGVEIQS